MEEENNMEALGQGFSNFGDLISRNANYLTNMANIRNDIFRRFDAMERRFDEIQGSINELDQRMIARVSNSNNILESGVIYYIHVN